MIFNSIAFLIFFPVFLAAYFSTRGRLRLWVMLAASLFFYGWWDWRYLFLLIASVFINYFAALRMEATQDASRRRLLITITCALNLTILGFFKYFDFFIASAHALGERLGVNLPIHTLGIVLPIGISFYTFHAMSYTIDVYRREFKADPDPVRVLTFVAFFPQLVAGPIVRGSELLPQLRRDQRPSWEAMQSGMQLVLLGFFKKVVVADSCAPAVNNIFAEPDLHSSINLLVGVYFYAMQIYCDFSGYSDIAIGIARIMGFELPKNFDKPYFSASFSEFWTRWHITLSRWLRDYLYIPLGGNRRGPLFTFRNLLITMFLGGLWHGANWTFVAWGLLHGLYLVLQRLLGPPFIRLTESLRIPKPVVRVFLVLLVFHLTCLAWVFFRSPDFATALTILKRIATAGTWNPLSIRGLQETARAVGLAGVLITCELVALRYPITPLLRRHTWLRVIGAAFLIVAILVLGNFAGQSFIYFQF
ncbi:MAG: MBOAT family O-acyltransferase [Phycisphaerales bacterium]